MGRERGAGWDYKLIWRRCYAARRSDYFRHNLFPLRKLHSLKEKGSTAGRAGLRLGHETHHVNTNKCYREPGGSGAFSAPVPSPKLCPHPSPWPRSCQHRREEGMEGSTPSPLSPLATAALLGKEQTGPPKLPITPCHPWSPQHRQGRTPQSCPRETLAWAPLEKLFGGQLPAWGLGACHGLL